MTFSDFQHHSRIASFRKFDIFAADDKISTIYAAHREVTMQQLILLLLVF